MQFFIVVGLPESGKNEYILRTFDNDTHLFVDGESFMNKGGKISYESIENSRIQCLEHVKHIFKDYFGEDEQVNNTEVEEQKQLQEDKDKDEEQQEDKKDYKNIVLSLYSNTPGKWIEFIELCIKYEYKVTFVKPTNHHFYYKSNLGDSKRQIHYLKQLFKNKMEVMKYVDYDDKGNSFVRESDLLRRLVLEFEGSLSFILNSKPVRDDDEEMLSVIKKKYENIYKKQQELGKKTKNELESIEKREREWQEQKLQNLNNKSIKKKSRRNMESGEDFTDEFYSDAKFKDVNEIDTQNIEDNFIIPKNRKQRLKEEKLKQQNNKKVASDEIIIEDDIENTDNIEDEDDAEHVEHGQQDFRDEESDENTNDNEDADDVEDIIEQVDNDNEYNIENTNDIEDSDDVEGVNNEE